ncbi:universal stress protein [Cupriavidus sp. D39]|uniref:universal stress protein n=1 Tax=Cupriavidus sp. D39 TaxID=2997877 RepID=UPI002270D164|nr:universal stress protein [Cupriavidus sp. D39]MCY0853563.1 universal stress protein [Cupriavidus sp. D39]
MYQRILLAVDGSRASELALRQAAIIAHATGSEVEALFVADNSDVFFGLSFYNPAKVMEGVLSFGREALAGAAACLESAGIKNTTVLLERPLAPGKISATLVAEADAWNADLIVMGTHGRRGVGRLVMGSVAEGVVRKTNKPVLLIRSESED